jgi:DNA-binding NarL/FixJ family response regulator
MISVLLVDDHAFILNSLRYFLEATEDIRVVSSASSGTEAISQARSQCPDVAIVDISMPNMDGIETTRQLCLRCQSTRVVMLSIYDNPEYVQRSLEVGAQGYVLKERVENDLLPAIRSLSQGKRYFSPKIAEIARTFFRGKEGDASRRESRA